MLVFEEGNKMFLNENPKGLITFFLSLMSLPESFCTHTLTGILRHKNHT